MVSNSFWEINRNSLILPKSLGQRMRLELARAWETKESLEELGKGILNWLDKTWLSCSNNSKTIFATLNKYFPRNCYIQLSFFWTDHYFNIWSAVRITDLGKLNLVKIRNDGLVLDSKQLRCQLQLIRCWTYWKVILWFSQIHVYTLFWGIANNKDIILQILSTL